MISSDYPFVCIVGAPRSGTTILGDVLSKHPDIGYLFEPYFIWDHCFGPLSDDVRTADMVTPEIASWIRREFAIYLNKTGCNVFLDKSPFSSFRIPFVDQVFPNCKYVNIQRDGREVVLSTYRKWMERIDYTQQGNYRQFFWEVWDKLRKRPFLRTKLMAILYELRYNVSFQGNGYYAGYYNGGPGWGVRYPGFEEDLKHRTLLEFNALQWRHSVEQIANDLKSIPEGRKLTVRYEEFLADAKHVVSQILSFIELPESQSIDVSNVKKGNQNTKKASDIQLQEIMPLIQDTLLKLGYLEQASKNIFHQLS